jgi:uncharacterized protein
VALLQGVAHGDLEPDPDCMSHLDEFGRSALHYAAADGDVSAVHRLVLAGEDVSAADRGGWTPLHFAAQSTAADAARVLLNAGAEVDARDGHGNTPLFRAVFSSRGSGAVISLLREAGADPLALNSSGQSPLGLSRLIANYDVRRFFDDLP